MQILDPRKLIEIRVPNEGSGPDTVFYHRQLTGSELMELRAEFLKNSGTKVDQFDLSAVEVADGDLPIMFRGDTPKDVGKVESAGVQMAVRAAELTCQAWENLFSAEDKSEIKFSRSLVPFLPIDVLVTNGMRVIDKATATPGMVGNSESQPASTSVSTASSAAPAPSAEGSTDSSTESGGVAIPIE